MVVCLMKVIFVERQLCMVTVYYITRARVCSSSMGNESEHL